MSHYEWESGTVTIPSAQWAAFKKALREGYNLLRAKDLETLANIHANVSPGCKGVATGLEEKVQSEAFRLERANTWSSLKRLVHNFNLLEPDDAKYLLVRQKDKTGTFQLVKPVSKAFPYPAADRNTVTFHVFDDARIVLNNTYRTVTWRIPEGNHAVARARESAMGQLLFKLLSKIAWTRNSGGVIYRNDEENSSGSDDGPGNDYIVSSFGPIGEAANKGYNYRG